MILVKKILGLVLTLFVVFSFVGVDQASAQFGNVCKCAWEFPICTGDPTGSMVCRNEDNDTDCPEGLTTIANPVCDRDGDGDGNACFNVAGACGGDPAPTTVPPTPTPLVDGYVQGRYRLQPGNVSIGETHFGSDANRLRVYLDKYLVGSDFVRPTEITSGGNGDTSTSYTSRGIVSDFVLNLLPDATWTARAFVPNGYSVGFTRCYNRTDCHSVAATAQVPNLGNTALLDENAMLNTGTNTVKYADVYWHYCRNVAPTNLAITQLACGQTGNQVVSWGPVSGALTYSLRIDNLADRWMGDVNGDGQCDNGGLGQIAGTNDYCVDNIEGTVRAPSWPVPNGLVPGSYRIWVHAINQCGGGGAVSASLDYTRNCTSPTVPVPTATGTTVSCQNITVWKNGVRIYEPYASILLNDRIEFRSAVSSSQPISKIYYRVQKGDARVVRVAADAICPAAGTTNRTYTASTTVLQDTYGSYNVRFDGVESGACTFVRATPTP